VLLLLPQLLLLLFVQQLGSVVLANLPNPGLLTFSWLV